MTVGDLKQFGSQAVSVILFVKMYVTPFPQHHQHAEDLRGGTAQSLGDLGLAQPLGRRGQKLKDIQALVERRGAIFVEIIDLTHRCPPPVLPTRPVDGLRSVCLPTNRLFTYG